MDTGELPLLISKFLSKEFELDFDPTQLESDLETTPPQILNVLSGFTSYYKDMVTYYERSEGLQSEYKKLEKLHQKCNVRSRIKHNVPVKEKQFDVIRLTLEDLNSPMMSNAPLQESIQAALFESTTDLQIISKCTLIDLIYRNCEEHHFECVNVKTNSFENSGHDKYVQINSGYLAKTIEAIYGANPRGPLSRYSKAGHIIKFRGNMKHGGIHTMFHIHPDLSPK